MPEIDNAAITKWAQAGIEKIVAGLIQEYVNIAKDHLDAQIKYHLKNLALQLIPVIDVISDQDEIVIRFKLPAEGWLEKKHPWMFRKVGGQTHANKAREL